MYSCDASVISKCKNTLEGQARWCTPLIPVLNGQSLADLSEFKASMVYIVSSISARAAQWDLVLKKEKETLERPLPSGLNPKSTKTKQVNKKQDRNMQIFHCYELFDTVV